MSLTLEKTLKVNGATISETVLPVEGTSLRKKSIDTGIISPVGTVYSLDISDLVEDANDLPILFISIRDATGFVYYNTTVLLGDTLATTYDLQTPYITGYAFPILSYDEGASAGDLRFLIQRY